jgi:hypothetical protein
MIAAVRFLASERLGFYQRVLEEGDVGAGDDTTAPDRPPAISCASRARLARALAVPAVAAGWRDGGWGPGRDALAKRLGKASYYNTPILQWIARSRAEPRAEALRRLHHSAPRKRP